MKDYNRPSSICPHVAAVPDEYFVWFTGRGCEHYWVCGPCAKKYPEPPNGMLEATDELYRRCEPEVSWEGICGKPEVRLRESSLHFVHAMLSLQDLRWGSWVDVQPAQMSNGKWIVILSSGHVAELFPREKDFKVLYRLKDVPFDFDAETGLCVSPKLDYGVVYQASNRLACVFDMASGKVTAQIDRGEYRPVNSFFPISFFESNGRTLLVAATAWNRLDVLDPATGVILTERGPTSYAKGEEPPAHYLDYFHAQLLISPENSWIVDNGWHWHPVGAITTWSLRDWLNSNAWESEDGPSRKGFGGADGRMVPAASLYDVRSGTMLRWFPGPECRLPRAWPPKKLQTSLFFDRYLFSANEERGTMVWDVATGECLHHDPSLIPIGYHPGSKEFLSITSGGVRFSRLEE
jgi:hypothetical protein